MPKITVFLDKEENREVEIFKAQYYLKKKEDAIKKVIRMFFKMKK